MNRPFLALALLLVAPMPSIAGQATVVLEAYAKVTHPPINEMSGIVKSRRYANTYWVHNDSGDRPRLFAIRADGSIIAPSWVNRRADAGVATLPPEDFGGVAVTPAANFDWEDIAYDGDYLYVGDVGNNGNARRDLGVYVVKEPNPQAVDATRPLTWLPIAYPDQMEFPPKGAWSFDCEAIFALRGQLYFLSKNRLNALGVPGASASLYRLETRHTDRPNVLRKLDTKTDLGGWVTGADVSPDGKTLAVLVQAPVQSVWLFDATARDGRFLSRPKSRLVFTGGQQCEAICFDDNANLIVANEQRGLYRISVSRFTPVK